MKLKLIYLCLFISSSLFAVEFSNVTYGPNPFDPSAGSFTVQYTLSSDSAVRLYIYAINGDRVYEDTYSATGTGGTEGENTITWSGTTRFGETAANGVYIAYLVGGSTTNPNLHKFKIAILR